MKNIYLWDLNTLIVLLDIQVFFKDYLASKKLLLIYPLAHSDS